jgi:aspartate/methionine/tyrosine aminotransferase
MSRAHLAARLTGLKPTAVNAVLQEVRRLQAEGRDLVSLMRGQPDTPTPPHVVEAACRALRDGRTGYPDNQGESRLREAVAEKLARDNGLTYDPGREILVTDGATCGLAVALAVLAQPGGDVLLPDPIYDAYGSAIALWHGHPEGARAALRGGRFTLDRDALEAAYANSSRLLMPFMPHLRARVLLLNTPWNPVGTVLTPAELQEIMEFAEANDLWVISDEIYEGLV